MAITRLFGLILLAILVPVSSLLGLVRPMTDEPVDGGWKLFSDVWEANFFGDLMFVLGTLGAGLAVLYLVRYALSPLHSGPQRIVLALAVVGAAVLLHWTVYALSWSLTAHSYLNSGETGFWAWKWQMIYDQPMLGLESAWTFTWCWGWAGLVMASIASPLGAWLVLTSPWARPAGQTNRNKVNT